MAVAVKKLKLIYIIAPTVALLGLISLPSITGTCLSYMPYRHACQGAETFTDKQYIGFWKFNVRSGTGTETMSNGDTYTGEFADNVRSGTGTETMSNGDTYTGEFADNVRSGTGTETMSNGDAYTGEFADNVRSGAGTETMSNGDAYTGEFADNVRSGTGTETMSNGDTYNGGFVRNVRSGRGKITRFATGTVIEAEYSEGVVLGGTITTSDETYTGELKEDEAGFWYEGQGSLKTFRGDTLSGRWEEGILREGRIDYSEGDIQDGEFNSDGNPHGKLTYTDIYGSTYSGNWINGELNGEAELFYFHNMARYTGAVVDRNPNGYGRFDWSNGTRTIGTWKSVQFATSFTYSLVDGEAEISFENGNVWRGIVVDGKPNGEGTFAFAEGHSVKGIYKTLGGGSSETNVLQDGYAEMTNADGSQYFGNFVGGNFNGSGTYFWINGEFFKGEWRDGKIDGYGVHRMADGTQEIGIFKTNSDGTFSKISD
jgi:hypothetical protein